MRSITINNCTGDTPEQTLKHQLIMHGVIKDSTEWSPQYANDPRSVFYHFKHYPAQGYVPKSVSYGKHSGHCGVCYHDIDYKFEYVSKTGGSFQSEWVDKDGETVIINYPETIVSGSECIHLQDDLKALTLKTFQDLCVDSLEYYDGMIKAKGLIKNAENWKTEVMAFPLEWYYFDEKTRHKLIVAQWNKNLGYHVEHRFEGSSVIRRISGAVRYYKARTEIENKYIEKREYRPTELTRAADLFQGTDKFGKRVNYCSESQPCSRHKYVILTRQQAINLAKEI